MSSGLGRTLGKIGKVAALGAGAGVAVLTANVVAGVKSLARMEKITAQTDAVIKSTGGTANVTRKQIEDMSDAIEKTTSVEAESVIEGQNMLLTFTNVRNEVGKGNDVFNQATSTLTDMSVAMGTDMPKQAIQLGKALNDPIKGISALSKVGVTFTEQQREQIKAMVESGDTMGAQKLILAELNKEFGGSAKALGETMGGRLEILKHRFGDIQEAIAARVLPYLERLMVWTERNWPTIERVITTTIDVVAATINFLIPIVSKLIDWFSRAVEFVREHWPEISRTVDNVMQRVRVVVEDVTAIVRAVWDRFGRDITEILKRALGTTIQVLRNAFAVVEGLFEFWSAVFHGQWGKAWEALKKVVSNALGAVIALIRGSVGNFLTAARALGAALLDGILGGLGALAGKLRDLAAGAGRAFVDGIRAGLSALGGALETLIKAPINALIRAWNALGVPSVNIRIPIPFAPDITFSTPNISLPDIPQLAAGGIVREPTVALIGERGPEAVVPLGEFGPMVLITGNTFSGYDRDEARIIASDVALKLAFALR